MLWQFYETKFFLNCVEHLELIFFNRNRYVQFILIYVIQYLSICEIENKIETHTKPKHSNNSDLRSNYFTYTWKIDISTENFKRLSLGMCVHHAENLSRMQTAAWTTRLWQLNVELIPNSDPQIFGDEKSFLAGGGFMLNLGCWKILVGIMKF